MNTMRLFSGSPASAYKKPAGRERSLRFGVEQRVEAYGSLLCRWRWQIMPGGKCRNLHTPEDRPLPEARLGTKANKAGCKTW